MKSLKLPTIIISLSFCFSGCSVSGFSEYQTCYGKMLSSICNQDFGICRNSYCKEQYNACLKTANEAENSVLNKRANDLTCR